MEFLFWHYTSGLKWYLRRWVYLVAYINHYFSLPLLLLSLFSPWKRLIDTDDSPGCHPDKVFQQLSFNLISRGIGAIVRLVLFVVGTLSLIPVLIAGLIGLVFWLLIPPIGLFYYINPLRTNKRQLADLTTDTAADAPGFTARLLTTLAGKFILSHLGLTAETFSSLVNSTARIDPGQPVSYSALIEAAIASGIWREEILRANNLDFTDLRMAAQWWDLITPLLNPDTEPQHFSRPGIGLELLFGYTPRLNQYVTDLSAPQNFSHHLIGRENLVSRIERSLTGGNSVILTGLPGVGKKTIVLEFARRAMAGELGPKMSYKRVLELDYNFLLSGSYDLNQKKNLLSILLKEAAGAGNVILVIKDIQRLTNRELEGLDFTDLFETEMDKHHLKIIAISSQSDYERFLSGNSRLRKYFETIEAVPISKEEALPIVFDFSSGWEKKRSLIITVPAVRAILEGSDKYITDTPYPEKALELLDHVVVFAEKNQQSVLGRDDVNQVLSERTGISMARLTQREKSLLGKLEEVLHNSLIGQEIAVSLIAKSLRARSVGVKDDSRPIGSFLFLGPTGVGKTQTAKTLAKVYYGDEKSILRFDMAEFAGEEGLTRLIGSVSRNQPGELTTAIKNRPASLLLLDEIEKTPPQVYNLFLTLLDEGSVTDAFGNKISCRHLFVIATSNAGAEYIRGLVAQGAAGSQLQQQVLEYIQQQHLFSPEFLNRFDGVVVYQPLTETELVGIAKLMVKDLQVNLLKQNITLKVADSVYQLLAKQGYQPELGARPMRRIVDIDLGDLLGKAILNDEVKPGDKIELQTGDSGDGYVLKHL